MGRGPKKHLKRVNAPHAWLMNKLGGNFAVRPREGPHKLKDCIPLQIMLKDKLKIALNSKEVKEILHEREGNILVDKKVRRDNKFPMGFMDVIEIPKLKKMYRVLFDVKRRFIFHKINKDESNFKLCRIEKKF